MCKAAIVMSKKSIIVNKDDFALINKEQFYMYI